MKKSLFVTTLLAVFVGAKAQTFNAADDYVVEDTGTYSSNSTYMNWGFVSSRYNSFAAFDFNVASLGTVSSVTSATLTVQESDFSSTSTMPQTLTFWAVPDNGTSLATGQTAVEDNDGVTGGYTNQLGTPVQLGTFVFNPTGINYSTDTTAPTNNPDVISFTTGLSSLVSQINGANGDQTSGVIRILVTSGQTGEVTWAGAGTSSAFIPTLALQATASPEPASLAFLGLGIVGLVARKRRK